ncbi:MAG TPA: hypothetical protein VLI43_13980 [Gemmatimonadaceae bacterium]|nr:hypothetical protein [Gemmatimonadaceae bacterium]
MPHALQQTSTQTSTPPADQSATDIAAQVRAQVNQQLRQAGMSEQAAKSAADAAAQQAKGVVINENGKEVTITTKNGKVVTIHTPGAPLPAIAPLAPLAPLPQIETGTSVPIDPPLDIPPRLESLGYALFLMIAVIAVGKPLARALGSVIERRAIKPAMPAEFGARLERIEQGIESVSIEVERISESQRYLLKVQGSTPERVEIPRSAS